MAAVLRSPAGDTFADGKALFVKLDPERFGPLLEKVAEALGVQVDELPGRLPPGI